MGLSSPSLLASIPGIDIWGRDWQTSHTPSHIGAIMHTETDTTATEQYITAHRGFLAILAWGTLTPLLAVTWAIFLDVVCHISSTNLTWASTILIALGTGIAALAFYWGGDES